MITFKNSKSNMTFLDLILIYRRYFTSYTQTLLNYVKTYKNFVTILINQILIRKYPIEGILKNGDRIRLNNSYEVAFTSHGWWKIATITDNVLTIKLDKNKIVNFFSWRINGDYDSVFRQREYDFLPVENRYVVDVGSNVADSTIYFLLQGAKKVIAIEPSPINFEIAEKNLKENKVYDKVVHLLSACSAKSGIIEIDPENGGSAYQLKHQQGGYKINTLSLKEITERYQIGNGILKIDCEGCEYDVILNSENYTLRKFSHIQIEYHFGYKNLKKKLEEANFQLKITRPYKHTKRKYYIGFIYATRID